MIVPSVDVSVSHSTTCAAPGIFNAVRNAATVAPVQPYSVPSSFVVGRVTADRVRGFVDGAYAWLFRTKP